MPRNRWKNALFRLLALLIVLSKQSPRPGNLMKPRHNDTTHLYHHKSKGNKATMAERRSILLVAASCLLSTASSMYITVDQEKFKCESRSVKAKFSYLCNPDAICSVSEEKTQYVEGTFKYYGLQDVFGATNEDTLVVDVHANINMLGGYTHRQKLVSMVSVPVCNDDYQADENNQYGDCPADGSYSFSTSFETEEPESPFLAWAMTGYKGEVVMNMYLSTTMELVGRCKAEMKTVPRGMSPSAKHVAVVCLLAAALFGLYIIILFSRPQWLGRLGLRGRRGNYLIERNTVAPYKRKDNSWSTTGEQIVMT